MIQFQSLFQSTVDVPRRESVDTFFSDTEEKPPSEPKINLYAKFKENMPELFDSDDDFGEDVKEKQGASGKLDQPSTGEIHVIREGVVDTPYVWMTNVFFSFFPLDFMVFFWIQNTLKTCSKVVF